MASVGLIFAKNVSEADNLGVESGQSENCAFDCGAAGREIETNNDIVDGGNGAMTYDGHFFVELVRQLMLRKRNGAGG